MTTTTDPRGEAGSRARAATLADDIAQARRANPPGTGTKLEITHDDWDAVVVPALRAFAASAKRTTVPIRARPMLVSGMLATDEHGPVILIDSEQGEYEQAVTLWHETLHLLGLTDDGQVEAMAQRLAQACPEILPAVKAIAYG